MVEFLLPLTPPELREARVTKGVQYTGATAVWVCAEKGRVEALRLLLAAGADPRSANVAGCTPLMVAADCGQLVAARLLLSAGGLGAEDVRRVDCTGCSALDFARDQVRGPLCHA